MPIAALRGLSTNLLNEKLNAPGIREISTSLALQLHFRFKMCLLCYGLMRSSPQ